MYIKPIFIRGSVSERKRPNVTSQSSFKTSELIRLSSFIMSYTMFILGTNVGLFGIVASIRVLVEFQSHFAVLSDLPRCYDNSFNSSFWRQFSEKKKTTTNVQHDIST